MDLRYVSALLSQSVPCSILCCKLVRSLFYYVKSEQNITRFCEEVVMLPWHITETSLLLLFLLYDLVHVVYVVINAVNNSYFKDHIFE